MPDSETPCRRGIPASLVPRFQLNTIVQHSTQYDSLGRRFLAQRVVGQGKSGIYFIRDRLLRTGFMMERGYGMVARAVGMPSGCSIHRRYSRPD